MTKYGKMRCFKCGSVNILFSYATGYECKDCGAKSGDPEGFVYDFIFPVKEDQQATIAQLTAERDEWKNKFTDALACNGRLVEQVEQLTAERDEWRKDAERLAKNHLSITKANQFVCSYCGYLTQDDDGIIVHQDTCPITLHRQLVAKYGGEK